MLGPLDLLLPPLVLLTSLLTLPFTLFTLPYTFLTQPKPSTPSWPALKHAWFQHFWFWFGRASKPLFAPRVAPLLARSHGVVLDIGPASGVWMPELARARDKITKIIGVEPNARFHAQLREAARRAGLAGVYEPVQAFAQELESVGVQRGSVDTVVTVHVLCSVGAGAEGVVRALYESLKPGGQWLVYEHVASRHGAVRAWQAVNNVPWGVLLDNCHLLRNTGDVIKNAGEWESVEIDYDSREGYFESLPHVVGRLVKKL
ncbi:hypothetical protein WHR41_04497 [Cladosporium halotolerans]|uniref:S-adenosyl-L-methionine-dependent methyltransferase n=1 Tax=Cladosporium halotolerans TaxID=1052096 RepID=A0AB34KTH6_9PEZI